MRAEVVALFVNRGYGGLTKSSRRETGSAPFVADGDRTDKRDMCSLPTGFQKSAKHGSLLIAECSMF